jgi:sec-independent protein translocase protein TatA
MSSLAFFQNMGVPELLIILFIILLLFGGAKLPSLARSLGSSVNEFKKGVKEGEATPSESTPAAQPPAAQTPADKK